MKKALAFLLLGLLCFSAFSFYNHVAYLFLNPYPNQAPYLAETDEGTVFNPFAIREVRYALNFLINRQELCGEVTGIQSPLPAIFPIGYSEILFGESSIWQQAGFSLDGDEAEGIERVTQALNAAAALPQLAGRLEKNGDGFWYFDGEQVQIKFIVRADYREQIANYIAAQLEKVGISATFHTHSLQESVAIVYNSDPAEMGWSAYTEGWESPNPRLSYTSRAQIYRQMYAPSAGYMPGRNIAGFWKYQNAGIDRKANDLINYRFFSEAEMKGLFLDIIKMGMSDAIRICLLFFQN